VSSDQDLFPGLKDPGFPGLEDPDVAVPHHAGHRERLRLRFLTEPNALPDYEILELLLASVIPRKDTKPLAKALIAEFKTFADVLAAPVQSLESFTGVSAATAAYLKVVEHAATRMARLQVIDRPVISKWDQLLDYCTIAMGRLPTEQFRLLFLDRKNVLIADELQGQGTVDHTPLYPREVVKRALDLNASAIIMVHNHPSGDPAPSRADIDMTKMVANALKGVGIVVHDHLIIGRKGHVSFKAQGLL